MDSAEDAELLGVVEELSRLDPDASRFSRVLRQTYDQIYDGQHTGRFRWEQLSKTEKTHFGSLLEINLQREFSLKDGVNLDFSVAGVDVDCKWSQSGQWMLPPEAVDQICLLMTGSDNASTWSGGLVRASVPRLNLGANRDAKKTLNTAGRTAIHWLWRNSLLPKNVLLHIDPAICADVMSGRSGQRRLDKLFRQIPHQIIGRGVIATVTQQDDYMKRIRDNGGSRGNLKSEGIVIFGDYSAHRQMAARLGLPKIGDGDSMSVRLKHIECEAAHAIEIDESWYRLCLKDEEPTKPAPRLPKAKSFRT